MLPGRGRFTHNTQDVFEMSHCHRCMTRSKVAVGGDEFQIRRDAIKIYRLGSRPQETISGAVAVGMRKTTTTPHRKKYILLIY